jgi:Nucleotidyltransferase domain
MNREALNAYDLGLPFVVAPVEERRQRVPAKVWAMVHAAKGAVSVRLGTRLSEVRLFGSYARNEETEGSDIDVLFVVADLTESDRNAVIEGAVQPGRGAISPLILSVAQLENLRAGELLIAQDLDLQGIPA